MNSNIDIINDNLWAVNMSYVKQGYIKELQLLPNVSKLGNVEMTTQGIILLDKSSELFPALKFVFLKAMTKTNKELQDILSECPSAENDRLCDLLISAVDWEVKRRCVKEEYEKSPPKSTAIDKLKQVRKKVKKWLQFKQE
jgi:hypothetical protein